MDQFELMLCDEPQRDELFVDIVLDGQSVADLTRPADGGKLTLYPRNDGQPWTLDLEAFVDALAAARKALRDHYGD